MVVYGDHQNENQGRKFQKALDRQKARTAALHARTLLRLNDYPLGAAAKTMISRFEIRRSQNDLHRFLSVDEGTDCMQVAHTLRPHKPRSASHFSWRSKWGLTFTSRRVNDLNFEPFMIVQPNSRNNSDCTTTAPWKCEVSRVETSASKF